MFNYLLLFGCVPSAETKSKLLTDTQLLPSAEMATIHCYRKIYYRSPSETVPRGDVLCRMLCLKLKIMTLPNRYIDLINNRTNISSQKILSEWDSFMSEFGFFLRHSLDSEEGFLKNFLFSLLKNQGCLSQFCQIQQELF